MINRSVQFGFCFLLLVIPDLVSSEEVLEPTQQDPTNRPDQRSEKIILRSNSDDEAENTLFLALPENVDQRQAGFRPVLPHPHQFYHGPKYPKQNCTVLDEIISADICTPTFPTECTIEVITTKRVLEKQYCFQLSSTECNTTVEVIDNEICTYEYIKKEEITTAKSVMVNFSKKCSKQLVTVCDYANYRPFDPYDPRNTFAYSPFCKEVSQQTCYNVPSAEPIDVPVSAAYPEPIKKCENKPISLPRISCQIKSEEKCIAVPEIEDTSTIVEKCQPVLGPPKCQRIELVLPKQVCRDIIYGFAHKSVDI